MNKTNKILIIDCIFLLLIVVLITFHPYFMHGAINFYETGIYLPQINGFLHGLALYKDIFVLRGPLEILMPAFLMEIFGVHIGVLNAYFYIGTVLTLLIFVIFSASIFKSRGFVYLFSLVLIARTFSWVAFNIWGGIRFGLGILAILFAVNFLKKGKVFWLFLSGIAVSLAFWTSFELGIFSFISIFAMICFIAYIEKNIRLSARLLCIFLIANFIMSWPFIIYLSANHAVMSYIDSVRVTLIGTTRVFNPALCYETPVCLKSFLLALSPLSHNFKYTLPFLFYIAVSLYLAIKIIKNKVSREDIIVIAILIYGVLLYKSAFRNIEGPHYRMAMQPLLLIMFFYLERISGYAKKLKPANTLKKAFIVIIIFGIPLFSILFSLEKYSKRFFIFKELKSIAVNKRHLEIPYAGPEPTAIKSIRAKGIIVPGAQALEIDSVVEYISSHASGNEIIFTFPDLGTYNFLTNRPSLKRFYSAEFSFMEPQWFEEMLKELKNIRPRFVVCAREYTRLKPFMPNIGIYLDTMDSYLKENYEIKRSFLSVNIFEKTR